jgi:hypothetical protein
MDNDLSRQYAAERSRRYRAKHAAEINSRRKPDGRTNRVRSCRDFVGVDGEGGGVDELGRQNFLLLRAGEMELYTGKHLTTNECLEFLCTLPPGPIYVGFYFGYDTTMILRDLSPKRLQRLFSPWTEPDGTQRKRMAWTFFGSYGIQYLPRQYLSVCRVIPNRQGYPTIVKGSRRTIYETGGFFQSKFIKQLDTFSIGQEADRDIIRRTKEDRSDFVEMTPEIRHYNALECDMLAELMTKYREHCIKADIVPRTWNGAGKLAAAMHTKHGTMTRSDVLAKVPRETMKMAHDAYYGGRFEITHVGKIAGPIYEYDIASAYPDAMRGLPCLKCGRWKPFEGKPPPGSLHVAAVHFRHPRFNFMCGLPVRQRTGSIIWPIQANGTYWSCEIESAERLGAKIKYKGGWYYEQLCSHGTFSWIEPIYNYRRSIGKSGEGLPIKFGINSLYGKLAQRIGFPRFGNFLWAGLITARTRAKLNDAIASDPASVVMVATDGIYSRKPLQLELSDNLGGWEQQTHENGIFIVKPGLWWTDSTTKTRGINRDNLSAGKETFYREFDAFLHSEALKLTGALAAPKVAIRTTLFTGLKLALARGKPETAGTWVEQDRNISFEWSDKRMMMPLRLDGGCLVTAPYPGAASLQTRTYATVLDTAEQADVARDEINDMPDHIDAIDMVLGDQTRR